MPRALRSVGGWFLVIFWCLAVLLVPSSASWADDELPQPSPSASPLSEPSSTSAPESEPTPPADPIPDPEPSTATCTPETPCTVEPTRNFVVLVLLLGGVTMLCSLALLVRSFGE